LIRSRKDGFLAEKKAKNFPEELYLFCSIGAARFWLFFGSGSDFGFDYDGYCYGYMAVKTKGPGHGVLIEEEPEPNENQVKVACSISPLYLGGSPPSRSLSLSLPHSSRQITSVQ